MYRKEDVKILIASEDNEELEALEFLIVSMGFDYRKADSLKKALEEVRNYMPKLIIADSINPKNMGFDIAHKIRPFKKYDKIRFIFLTDTLDTLVRKRGYSSEDFYIFKPYTIDNMKRKINQLFEF